MDMNGLSQLRQLAIDHSRKTHPGLPEYMRCTRTYSDRTANALTKCIIDFLQFSGYQAERINSTGRPIDNTKIVTDVTGHQRRIGSMKWIPGTGQKGTADISATIRGKSVKIEVKMKDRQSPAQKKYQEQIEQAGGVYMICRSFQDFLKQYEALI